MNNPYLDEFLALGILPFEILLAKKCTYEEYAASTINNWKNRGRLIHKYSFAIPNEEAIHTIKKYAPIIEIGAGNGYWASLIEKGIVAFDNYESRYSTGDFISVAQSTSETIIEEEMQPFSPIYFPVQKGDHTNILKYPDHTLFLCWPPNDDGELLRQCLAIYTGKTLLYVGESNACTSWDDEALESWEEVETIHIPQWNDIHDYLMVFNRK